ncbi:hypothetical protein M422DRAFT_261392 [Sphaerobolus stellatus SS14]|uniref:Uncharacterized protein n=1 Tax=Sphaerobolus stellatus (strain SS14) TaxID=990650 RepID=A0A0C9V3D1_SPHS4|nr:hypothetical protein M422DRAFT_261392 [Sphaerobolus stellatus SS14]
MTPFIPSITHPTTSLTPHWGLWRTHFINLSAVLALLVGSLVHTSLIRMVIPSLLYTVWPPHSSLCRNLHYKLAKKVSAALPLKGYA